MGFEPTTYSSSTRKKTWTTTTKNRKTFFHNYYLEFLFFTFFSCVPTFYYATSKIHRYLVCIIRRIIYCSYFKTTRDREIVSFGEEVSLCNGKVIKRKEKVFTYPLLRDSLKSKKETKKNSL